MREELLQAVAVEALRDSRRLRRLRSDYTRAMRAADEADEDARRARLRQVTVGGILRRVHRERIRALLTSLAARVPSDRYFYTWTLQTPATQQKILSVLCAELPGLGWEKVKEYVRQALSNSRSNCRARGNYTPAMREADERAEAVQRVRLVEAALGNDDGTEDDAVPQPTGASPPAGRGPITPADGNQRRGEKRALESSGRDGGGEAPVAKRALVQPSVEEAPAGPSQRSPTASADADTLSGDAGRAPACPASEEADAGILGAVDAFLAVEGTILAEEWKERLRGVIRDAAAREQTGRAELARRVSDRLKAAMAALVE